MSDSNQDLEFTRHLKRRLDEAEQNLDAGIRSRLTQTRYQALAQRKENPSWWPEWIKQPLPGMAAAFALVLALALTLNGPPSTQPGNGLEDMDLLTAEDQLELYEDLEFYAWLAQEETTEQHESG